MSNKLIRSMMEPLVSKFQSIEDRLTNLEEIREILSAHKEMINKHKELTNAILKKKEITDKERLDFIQENEIELSFHDNTYFMASLIDGRRAVGLKLRTAIDDAMRFKEEVKE